MPFGLFDYNEIIIDRNSVGEITHDGDGRRVLEFRISPSIIERLKGMTLFNISNCHFKLQNL